MRRGTSLAAAIVSLLILPVVGAAQNDNESYEAWKKRQQEEYNNYKRQQRENYESFRKKANAEYAEFVKKHWEEMQAIKGVKPPQLEPVPPVICPDEDKDKERKDKPKPFHDVVVVEPPKPQPQPVEPIKPVEPITPKKEKIGTRFYGTSIQCTVAMRPKFTLTSLNEDAVSNALKHLSDGHCDDLLAQCLELRDRHRLSDWGYIQLLDSLSKAVFPQSTNKATLLMSWLYCQSGYKMRLARSGGYLYMLYASDNIIYTVDYSTIDGTKYYIYNGNGLGALNICGASFPKEQTMTLRTNNEPKLAYRGSKARSLQSKRYPNINVSTIVNRNLIDFYNDYPTGAVDNDFSTRWTIYANTPLGDEARKMLYPQLQKLLDGKSKLQAAEELLNFVQTAFVYEYDDKVWGGDRAFFAEETLYYPYSDCEDRSILFSRLVRDLLGLEVVLIYYPNHLATAVRFEGQQPTGDYLDLPDGKYFIADPTYIGATVGMSMPSMRDKKVTVIKLKYDNH